MNYFDKLRLELYFGFLWSSLAFTNCPIDFFGFKIKLYLKFLKFVKLSEDEITNSFFYANMIALGKDDVGH